MNHPHIHCVVPSGGLTFDGTRWINSKNDFFIPVKVLSRKFRGNSYFILKKLIIVMLLNILLELRN